MLSRPSLNIVWSSMSATRTAAMVPFLPLKQDPSRKARTEIAQRSILEGVLQTRTRGETASCSSRQPAQHEPAHRPVDHRLCGLGQPFVVLAEPPRQAQPREGALHDPTARQHLETARLILQPVAPQLPVRVVWHFQAPPQPAPQPLAKT